jgi:hypothetical protein
MTLRVANMQGEHGSRKGWSLDKSGTYYYDTMALAGCVLRVMAMKAVPTGSLAAGRDRFPMPQPIHQGW